jgi:hypothetical protein
MIPWGHLVEHGAWVLALGLLMLASAIFYRELAYSAFFALVLTVVLLGPAVTGWNCIVSASCEIVGTLNLTHAAAFPFLVLVWLSGPVMLAAKVIEPWWRTQNLLKTAEFGGAPDSDRKPSSRGAVIRVYLIATTLSLLTSTIGGANSRFWAQDLSLGESLLINAIFVLPFVLLPIGMIFLRRGLVAGWHRYKKRLW